MKISPQKISDFSYSRRFIRGIGQRSLVPLIMLECFVTGGRTLQAYDRGGFEEARERFTEESIGAAFWFGGVKMFNKMNDAIGKKLLNLHTADFDATKDGIRDPLKNFLHDDKAIKAANKANGKTGKLIQNLTTEQIAKFKALKIGSSILLANILVGLVVPKINQHITAVYHEKHLNDGKPNSEIQPKLIENSQNPKITPVGTPLNMDKFMKKDDEKKDLSFGMNYGTMLAIANKFENDATYQLLSTDVGIAGGRAVSARNNHERIEVLFRDLTSIYFYMFSMSNINRWLNQLEDGRKTRLDPVAAEQVTRHLNQVLIDNGGRMSVEDFINKAKGDNSNVGYIDKDLLQKFNDHKVVTLDEFKEYLNSHKTFSPDDVAKYSKLAEKMSKLQPQVEGVSLLTKNQIKDIFRGGAINMPEFLENVYGVATQGGYKDKYKFISNSELESLKEDIVDYVDTIIKKAKKNKGEITADLLKKVNRENFIKNTANWGVGFAISALFLSTLIPKMQYWITKVRTGQNSFPGTTDYSQEKKS